MKNKTQHNGLATATFETGQVWQMDDSTIEVGLVGRMLVHYKHYKGEIKRAPTRLSSKTALQKLLQHQKAVLLANPRRSTPAEDSEGTRATSRASSPARRKQAVRSS